MPAWFGPWRGQILTPEDAALIPRGAGNRDVQPPTKLFDQLYYFGNGYVGVVVLKTSAGLIQWDSMDNAKEIQDIVAPGYKAMGLNMADVKYIILTHGHSDHYGGAAYQKQQNPGLHILASDADWKFMDYQRGQPLKPDRDAPPVRDQVVRDGQKLTLGDTTISLYVTPGHTPGPVSSIFKVTDNGAPHVLAMYGGVSFPEHLKARPNVDAGLDSQIKQAPRFIALAKKAGADGVISTHPAFDGMRDQIKRLASRKAGDPNPIIIGKDAYDRYGKMYVETSHVVRAAVVASGGD
jgi:metallo-beta-lactamase class B